MDNRERALWQKDASQQRLDAIENFEGALRKLRQPVARISVKSIMSTFYERTFELDAQESAGMRRSLNKFPDTPKPGQFWNNTEQAFGRVKGGLFKRFIEDYVILHGIDDFREWAMPFMAMVVSGHTEKTGAALDHRQKCTPDNCPAAIIGDWLQNNLLHAHTYGTLKKSEEHMVFSDEVVAMNVETARCAVELGVVSAAEGENLLHEYRGWLASLPEPFSYDDDIFEPNLTEQ